MFQRLYTVWPINQVCMAAKLQLYGRYVGRRANHNPRVGGSSPYSGTRQANPGEVLVSDRTLQALEPVMVKATKRQFAAKGAPADLAAHAVQRAV
jgi:hypothetical protein